ncbi:hypothetical protein KRP22_000037 [Phytophthora ramorum]|nr:hypothetical protein KRP22_11983 [Phytophthora ramorum]
MATRTRTLKYLDVHELRYAIGVVARDETSGDVTEAVCLFCKHFGREQRADKKRKNTSTVKFFRESFRPDQYTQHHLLQHPTQWERYKSCSNEDKQHFFPSKSTETTNIQPSAAVEALIPSVEERGRCFDLKAAVVEVVAVLAVGLGPVNPTVETRDRRNYQYMLHHDYEEEEPTNCPRWSPPPDTFQSCQLVQMEPPVYRVVVYSKEQMDLLMEMAAQGLSSAQISRTLQVFRNRAVTLLEDVIGDAPMSKRGVILAGEQAVKYKVRVGGMTPEYNEDQTAEFVRLGVAASISIIASLMEDSWAFSLELCTVAQHSLYSYLDVRVKFYNRASGLCSAHLLAIPKYVEKCDIMMFRTLDRVLTAVLPKWRKRLLGITTNGDIPIPIRIDKVIEHFHDAVSGPALHRANCCGNQLQRTLDTFYASIDSGHFLLTLQALSEYARNEPNLLSEMKRHPDFRDLDSDVHGCSGTRAGCGREVDRIATQSTLLRAYFKLIDSASEPPVSWWLALEVLQWITTRSNPVFATLEKQHATISQQGTLVASLAEECITGLHAQIRKEKRSGPKASTSEFISDDGRVVLSKSGMLEFVMASSALARELVKHGGTATVHATTEHLAPGAANMIASLVELSIYLKQQYAACTNSESNKGSRTVAVTDILPPVLPHELARFSPTEFRELLQAHEVASRGVLNEAGIKTIREEHGALCHDFAEDEDFRCALKNCTQDTRFNEAWGLTNGRFKHLEALAGGLATVRPLDAIKLSEANVGDLVLCPKDMEEARLLFADLELESVLHAQQFQPLTKLQEEIYDQQEEMRSSKRQKRNVHTK